MSKMLSKMNLISVVQQLPKEDIETIQGYVEMIERENQELKKQVENYKKLGFKHLVDKNNNLETQQKDLKKQLEEFDRKLFFTKNELDMRQKSIDDKLIQQKVFIKYLEDEINKWNYNYDSYNYEYEVEEPTAEELANKILQKYKEIIGDDK